MSERFKELVLKTSDTATYRGFESHSLRQSLGRSCFAANVIYAFGTSTLGEVLKLVTRRPC